MKTGHLLYVSQINRETFNALKRRRHLAFLDKHHIDEGVNRYGPWHALGMAAFSYLRRLGIETAQAGGAVDDSWPDIIRIAGLIDESPRDERCGVRINDLNVADTFGWHHPESRNDEPVAYAAVNLRVLWEWIQPLIEATKNQADGESED